MRRRGCGCTRRPVVTISSPMEEREEEGWEEISTQDSEGERVSGEFIY